MKKMLVAALAAIAIPASVSAATPNAEVQVNSVAVRYSDLALEKSAGAETLSRRVNAAVQAVCQRPEGKRGLKVMRDWQQCRDAAASAAKAKVSPMVALSGASTEVRY